MIGCLFHINGQICVIELSEDSLIIKSSLQPQIMGANVILSYTSN